MKKQMKYAEDLKKYQQELTQSVSAIPKEKQIDPSIQITAQALENSKYCISSNELRTMFVNLITSTMNKDFEPFVHPSFPEILKQMSPKDAHFLTLFKTSESIPLICLGLENSSNSYRNIFDNVCVLKPDGMSDKECETSISALQRAGLISTSYTQWFSDEKYYEPFKNHPFYKSVETIASEQELSVHLQRGQCSVTALGKDFIHVCIE